MCTDTCQCKNKVQRNLFLPGLEPEDKTSRDKAEVHHTFLTSNMGLTLQKQRSAKPKVNN